MSSTNSADNTARGNFHQLDAMLRHEWMRRTAWIAGVALIALCQHLTKEGSEWRILLARLYYVPILGASLYEGWRYGLLVALTSSATLLLSAYYGTPAAGRSVEMYVDPGLFCAIAVVTGMYTDRERSRKMHYQQIAGQLSDVYEKLQTNFEGMKRAERLSAIGQLSAGLAHEIRNPLASIAGAASILRRGQTFDAKASKCLEIIESECKRMNGLLTTFLNFARPRPPQLQAIRLDTLLDSVIALAEHSMGNKSVKFQTQIASGMPPIESDPEQMTQVLLNLLINATEASAPGSMVTLVADQVEGSARIQVVDHGSGVAPEDIDKLFNPFFTTKETGTGLGLPVAHQIVGQMGGLLTAHRNHAGGMTFTIEFPLKYSHRGL